MKKILLVISAFAVMAVSCKPGAGTNNQTAAGDAGLPTSQSGTVKSADVVYFELDSLLPKYDMYTELQASFEAKSSKVQKELENKGRALERDIANYQDKTSKGLVTTAQANQMAAKLEQDRNSFMQFNEQKSGELNEEQMVMLNNIHHSIVEFLKEFNSDNRYGLILSSSNGTPVMNGNPSLNITMEVLEGLNKKYAADIASGTVTRPVIETPAAK